MRLYGLRGIVQVNGGALLAHPSAGAAGDAAGFVNDGPILSTANGVNGALHLTLETGHTVILNVICQRYLSLIFLPDSVLLAVRSQPGMP
jgi:hypothetical protein